MSEFLGKTIGDYQVVEDLDDSGDTMVFKGFQPSMNRYVAIKILKPSATRDPNALQRFLQQGELLARMHHPNLLDVYISGQEEGVFYRVERLAEGGSLRDHLNRFQDMKLALGLFEQIVAGLEYIHAQGYVHGNLEPRSIYLDDRQAPLLGGFGTPPSQTQPPSSYLAPEQVQGGVVDARADVYALGVLAFEVSTGQAPPPGMVFSLRTHRPDLPEALEQTVLKAMAQSPDQRFRTVGEFLAAMQNALQEPVQVQPSFYQPASAPAPIPSVSQTVTVQSQKGRTSWLAIVMGIIVIGLLCIGGFLAFRYLTQDQRTETGELLPIQHPAGPTIIVPTIVLPTREPRPSQPAVEPTNPPVEPTQPPVEPTDEQPSEESPSQPTEESQEGRGGQLAGKLPEPCGSVGFISLGLVLVSATRIRKRTTNR